MAVNESEAPDVKSIFTALPSAVSGGQLPVRELVCQVENLSSKNILLVRGLQLV